MTLHRFFPLPTACALFAAVSLTSLPASLHARTPGQPPATPAPACVLTLEVSQLHWTLDPVEHLKDHLNAVQFELPADPGFCKDVKVGTLLDGSFRWGSWLFRQNYGQWSVRVVGKRLAGEDASVPVGRASEVPPPTARPARATASEARAPRLPGKPFDPGPVPALEPVLKPGGGPP